MEKIVSDTLRMKLGLPDQHGKTAVVTGTGGIGFAAARELAGAGASVILAGRDAEAGAKAVSDIRAKYPEASIRFEPLDLADSDSVASFAVKMSSDPGCVDILMCIAGVMMPEKLRRTSGGAELQFGVNYLSHFELTAGLFPLLKAAPDARVVTISSIANLPVRFNLSDAKAERGYSASLSYALSKLCCLMFAVELAKRSGENGWGVSAYCVHPGLARTKLFDRSRHFMIVILRAIFSVLPFIRQSARSGALPALFAATSPKAISGCYYGPWFYIMGPSRPALIPIRAKQRKLREKLWDLSVGMTGKEIL